MTHIAQVPSNQDGQVPTTTIPFSKRLDGLHARSRETRLDYYKALLDVGLPLDGNGLPRKMRLIDDANSFPTTFFDAFGPGKHPNVGTSHLAGVERVVFEAKAWTFEPYARGWRVQRRAMKLHPRIAAEALLAVLAEWAYDYPGIARLQVGTLPEPAADHLAGLGPSWAEGGDAGAADLLIACGRKMVQDTVGEDRESQSVSACLNGIRADFSRLSFGGILLDEGTRLLNAIGRFTALLTTTASRPEPLVIAGLEAALRVLRDASEPNATEKKESE